MKKGIIRLADNRPIGFTDSGANDLTVAKKALEQLPNKNILFIRDTARCPYGPKPAEQVIQYTQEVTGYLVEQGIKVPVIACNAATTVVLKEIKAALSIPVIGVILPDTGAAVEKIQNKQVDIISTIGTIKSRACEKTLKEKVPELTVTSLAYPKFISVVKSNEYHSSVAEKIVAGTLAPLMTKEIDTLVSGCTHYPLLRPIIQNIVGENVQLIDSGAEAVDEVSMLLDYFNLSNSPQNGRTLYQFYTTGSAKLFQEIAEDWLGIGRLSVDHIELRGNRDAS